MSGGPETNPRGAGVAPRTLTLWLTTLGSLNVRWIVATLQEGLMSCAAACVRQGSLFPDPSAFRAVIPRNDLPLNPGLRIRGREELKISSLAPCGVRDGAKNLAPGRDRVPELFLNPLIENTRGAIRSTISHDARLSDAVMHARENTPVSKVNCVLLERSPTIRVEFFPVDQHALYHVTATIMVPS